MEKLLYKPHQGQFNLLMGFPAIKAFALSSVGYLWLYKIADEFEGINADRIYTDSDFKYRKIDALSFSMSFDFDFQGVFSIMEKLSIPLKSSERNDTHPLIFAGGPVITTNPTLYNNFFDFMIIGDGEEIFYKVLTILKENNKTASLEKLEKIEGIYIPNKTKSVRKTTVELNDVIYTPILSDESYFKNNFIIEVTRGCMNRCAFCTASYTNLPFRSYEYEKIIKTIDFGLKHTNKIALLGAQISAHPKFGQIMEYIKTKIDRGADIELGISSLRTDSITPDMVQTLVAGGQKHSTIAIEAASERLRKLINKNLKEEQILNAVKICRENGLQGLKIYSMIGIPTESDSDIDEFLSLTKKIKQENKGFFIEFSFSTFVPKPQTPFQWSKRADTKYLEKTQKYLEKEFAKLGVSSKFSSPKWDYWQTVISRGGEELSDFLIDVYRNGGKLGAYKSASKNLKLDLEKYIRGYEFDEKLPWDIVENYTSKERLFNEYKRLNSLT